MKDTSYVTQHKRALDKHQHLKKRKENRACIIIKGHNDLICHLLKSLIGQYISVRKVICHGALAGYGSVLMDRSCGTRGWVSCPCRSSEKERNGWVGGWAWGVANET